MKLQSTIATAVGILLFASVSFAQHVRTDYDHNANFERYHTYSCGRTASKKRSITRFEKRDGRRFPRAVMRPLTLSGRLGNDNP